MAAVMLEETYPENTGKFCGGTNNLRKLRQANQHRPAIVFDEHFAKEYEFNGTDWQKREEKNGHVPKQHLLCVSPPSRWGNAIYP